MSKLAIRSAAALLAASLLFPAVPHAADAATELTDIEGSYAKDAILELVEAGIIQGNGSGQFNPTGNIKRQDFAIIMAKALNLDVEEAPATPTFSDVPASHYSYKYVEAAHAAGLINGKGDGQFDPTQNLTREQMAVLFVRALGVDATGKGAQLTFEDRGSISDWAKDAVGFAVEAQLMSGSGNGTFDPSGSAQRQQVALVASNFLKVQQSETALSFSASLVDLETLSLSFNKEVALQLRPEQFQVALKATGQSVTVSGVSLSEDRKSASLELAELVPGTTYTVTFLGKTSEITTGTVKMEVTPSTASAVVGTSVQFSAKLTAQIGSQTIELDKPISWSASGGSIDQSGLFQASTTGTFTITASHESYSASASVSAYVPYVPPADTTAPVLSEVERNVVINFPIPATSSENGFIYVVPFQMFIDTTPTRSQLEAALDGEPGTALKQAVSAGISASLPTTALSVGSYHLYAVDAAGNVSTSETVNLMSDTGSPVLTVFKVIEGADEEITDFPTMIRNGTSFKLRSNEAGTIFIMDYTAYEDIEEPTANGLKELVTGNRQRDVAANEDFLVGSDLSLSLNTDYVLIAADLSGNLSVTKVIRLYELV
ncbi:S-layer homology domain-containing protein [Paenibacillus soyae]|uniref:S-layer homology domain-containing protein n=1 Tax=Paenibacillus soyae TaxID=2969249 RepID=A0A9X2MS11_9BACL|nr:S-layer homology domain-containing protein [Paenibacillus soyae]MCR2805285.1 S-layer homology domain-containing protein [Paenibacillus soyae]